MNANVIVEVNSVNLNVNVSECSGVFANVLGVKVGVMVSTAQGVRV